MPVGHNFKDHIDYCFEKKKLYTVEDWKYMCMYMYTYMHVNRLTLCNTLYPIMMLLKILSTSIIVSQKEGLVQLIQVSLRSLKDHLNICLMPITGKSMQAFVIESLSKRLITCNRTNLDTDGKAGFLLTMVDRMLDFMLY